ncbi:MAG: hypothetical protein QOC73_1766, partial [Actinomycetota bacterium]|nr:hypothetical protein [Actinomycetota bacterium]
MLTDKICIVTGGGSGIGRAIAIEMAHQRAGAVVIADIDEDGGPETARLVAEAGSEARFIRTDLRKPAEIRDLMDATAEQFGGIDVLNNNAGRSIRRPLAESLERWHDVERTMTLN